jgi:hypothetical protein
MGKRVIVSVSTLAILIGILLFAPTVYCFKPGSRVPLGIIRDHNGPPQEWITALVEREGGLPKSTAALTCYTVTQYNCDIGLAESLDVYPVQRWEIERVTISGGNLLPSVLRGELIYSINVDMHIHYTDGESIVFRWDTWRYGWSFGPIAIDTGGGPTGDLSLISSNTG